MTAFNRVDITWQRGMDRVVKNMSLPCTPLEQMKISTVTTENSMGFLKKLRIELQYDPAIPLLSIYLKNIKILIFKYTYIPLCSLQHY